MNAKKSKKISTQHDLKNFNPTRFEKFQQKNKFLIQKLQGIHLFLRKADQYLDKCIQAIKDQDFLFVRKQIRIFKKINFYKNDLNKSQKLKLLFEKLSIYKSLLEQNYEHLLCRFNSQIRKQPIVVKKTINKAIKIVEIKEDSNPIDINFYITQGQELLKLQNYQQALENFNNAIQLNPQCQKAHFNKGHTLFSLKQYKEALQCYDKVTVEENQDVFFFINKGCALLKLNSHKEAIEFFDEALKLDPIDLKIYFYKGKALLKQNQNQEAIDQFTIANDIKPCSKYCLKISDTLLNYYQLNIALKYIQDILKVEPNNHKAINLKGLCLRAQNKYKEALQLFDEAIRIENKKPDYHRNKGLCLLDMGKYQEAIEVFKVTLILDKEDYLAHFFYGIKVAYFRVFIIFQRKIKYFYMNQINMMNVKVNQSLNQFIIQQLCDQIFDYALILNPKESQHYFQKGNALLNLNKFQEAFEYYDEAINLFDQDYKYYSNRGLSLYKLKKYQEAIDSINQALQLYQEDLKVYVLKCDSLCKMKRFNEAEACMDNVIKLDQNNFKHYLKKGDILSESKRIDEAVQCYTQALKLNPKYEEELIKKGDELAEAKDYIEAFQIYDRVVQINPKNKSVIKKRDKLNLLVIEQGTNQVGEEFKNLKKQIKEAWNEFLDQL